MSPGDQWYGSGIRASELAQPFPPPLPVMHGEGCYSADNPCANCASRDPHGRVSEDHKRCVIGSSTVPDIPYRTAPSPAPDFNRYSRLLFAQAVQQWEYLQEEIPQTQWQVRLTELGAEGWEMVHQIWVERFGPLDVGESWQTATIKMEGWRCFFKRPKVTT